MLGDATALRLPRIALTELAAVADQHQQRNAIELRARHDPVHRRKEAMVLHQHRGLHAGEVRPSRDADAFLLLREADEGHRRILFRHANEVHEPRLRKRGDDPHADGLEALVDQFRGGCGYWHLAEIAQATYS